MKGAEGLREQGRAPGSALSPGWCQGHLRPAVWDCPSFPEGSRRHAFAQVLPSSLSTSVSISIWIRPVHFQNLSQGHSLQRAPFSPSHCSQPVGCAARAHCAHLINTLVTHSVAAQLLVSEPGAPPAGEVSQGRAAALVSPGLGTAARRSRSEAEEGGAFSAVLANIWACSVSPTSPFLEPSPHPLLPNLLMAPRFGRL